MKVNSTVLTHFLNRCMVNTHGINNASVISMIDTLLVVDGNKMKVEGLNPPGNLQIEFTETLSEEFEHEEFPIVDTKLLHKLISSEFDNEELNVYMEGNDIWFESEMTKLNFPTIVEVETMARYPEARDKIKEAGYGKVEFKTCVTMSALNLSKAIGKSGGTYNLYLYEFIVENGEFMIKVQTDEKGGVVKKTISTVEGPDCSGKYSTGIDTIFKGMTGEVKIYLNQDVPLMVVDENKNIAVFFPMDI